MPRCQDKRDTDLEVQIKPRQPKRPQSQKRSNDLKNDLILGQQSQSTLLFLLQANYQEEEEENVLFD